MSNIQLFPAIEGASGMYGRHFESQAGVGRMEVSPSSQDSDIEAYVYKGFYTNPVKFDVVSDRRTAADIIDDDQVASQVARIATLKALEVELF